MAAKRSRTGCQTCRSRKLKCDETRPRCGPCTKSRRECIPSDGIAFRHEQNASMNAGTSQGTKGLQNFFKYRNEFDAEQISHFVPIPKDLKFVHIEDPFSEEQNPGNPPPSPGSYQQVAAHSLEALSTAATDHPAYGTQNTFADYGTTFASNGNGRSGYGPAGVGMGAGGLHGSNNQNNGINFLLNPSNIDPSLESNSDAHMPQTAVRSGDMDLSQNQPSQDTEKLDDSEEATDLQLAALLRDAGAADEVSTT